VTPRSANKRNRKQINEVRESQQRCCARQNDSISTAEKKDGDKPCIAETKAIAEEAYIYGLPLVMNYASMYAMAIDKNSGQFLAPFNQIKHEARVYTYKDTAVVTPNSDTPYLLAEAGSALDPATRQRHAAATGHRGSEVKFSSLD
jgi:hypothetical protein